MQRNKQDKDRSLLQIDVTEKSLRPTRLPPAGRKPDQKRGDAQAASSALRPIFPKKRSSEDLATKPTIPKKKTRFQTISTPPKSTFEHMTWLTQASEEELSNLTNYLVNRKPKLSIPVSNLPQEKGSSYPKLQVEISGQGVVDAETMLPRRERRRVKLADRWDFELKDQQKRTIKMDGGQRQSHRLSTDGSTGGNLCDVIYGKARSRFCVTQFVKRLYSFNLFP